MMDVAKKVGVPPGGGMRLETGRLWLRAPVPADVNDLIEIWDDPEVMRYLPTGKPRPAAESRKMFENFTLHWRLHHFGPWSVCYRDTCRVIGYCGLRRIPARPELELLYGYRRDAWGKGIGLEAAEAALAHGFDTLPSEWVIAAAMPGNTASLRIMARLGMKPDDSVRHYGEDAVHFSILRAEFVPPPEVYRMVPA